MKNKIILHMDRYRKPNKRIITPLNSAITDKTATKIVPQTIKVINFSLLFLKKSTINNSFLNSFKQTYLAKASSISSIPLLMKLIFIASLVPLTFTMATHN